jgi:hypothetical protein
VIYGVFYCLRKSEVFRNWPIVARRDGLQSTVAVIRDHQVDTLASPPGLSRVLPARYALCMPKSDGRRRERNVATDHMGKDVFHLSALICQPKSQAATTSINTGSTCPGKPSGLDGSSLPGIAQIYCWNRSPTRRRLGKRDGKWLHIMVPLSL